MKIDKITLSNFRNYHGEVSFDLTRKITILHGDNGFGKSSFFDAIEWCFTSKISRMNGSDVEIKRDIFNKNCNHQQSETLSVSIEFGGNTLTRWFTVTGNDYGNTQVLLLDSEGIAHRGQVDVENFLKQRSLDETSFGRGGYGQLIKQTYILSQSQVTDFVINEKPSDRFRALANIMGFKALLNESDNMKKIYSSLIKQTNTIDTEITLSQNTIKGMEEAKKKVDIIDYTSKLHNVGIVDFDNGIDVQVKRSQDLAVTQKLNSEKFIEIYNEMQLDRFETVSMIMQQITEKEEAHENLRIRVEDIRGFLKRIDLKTNALLNEKGSIQKFNKIRISIQNMERELASYELADTNINSVKENLNILRNRASLLEFAVSFQSSIASNIDQQKSLPVALGLLEKKEGMLEKRIEKLQKLIEELSSIIQKNKDNLLLQLITNIKDIKSYVVANSLHKCPVCSSTPEEDLQSCIDHNILSYTTKLEEDTSYVDKIISLRNKISNKLAQTKERISEAKSNRTMMNMELDRLRNEYNTYKSNILFSEELLQSPAVDLNNQLEEVKEQISLQQKAVEIIISLEKAQEELKDFGNKVSSKRIKTEEEVEQSLDRMKRAHNRVFTYQSKLEYSIRNLNSDIQDNQIIIKRLQTFLDPQQYSVPIKQLISESRTSIAHNERKINRLSDINQIQFAIKQNQEIHERIQEHEKTIEILVNKKNEIKRVAESLKSHMMHLFDFFDSDAKNYLNNNNSPIQKYYRYLNPLPSNNLIQFDGSDEELSIKVVFEDGAEECNAQNILSSGQLNVLAISIFLAINEAQNINSLDFIAIDDPIQNMDDVNQYSICDVLGQINKQIIFSTHDLDFVKLFLKKNEHKKEEIQVYNFTSPFLDKDKIQRFCYG